MATTKQLQHIIICLVICVIAALLFAFSVLNFKSGGASNNNQHVSSEQTAQPTLNSTSSNKEERQASAQTPQSAVPVQKTSASTQNAQPVSQNPHAPQKYYDNNGNLHVEVNKGGKKINKVIGAHGASVTIEKNGRTIQKGSSNE